MAAISTMYLSNSSVIGIGALGTDADAQGTFTTIGGIYSGTFQVSHNIIDTTNSSDSGQTSMLLGNTTYTLSFECRYSPEESGQLIVEQIGLQNTHADFKTAKAFMVQPLGGSDDTYTFEGYVTSVSLNPNENDNSVNLSVEVQSTGVSNLATATPDFDATGGA